MQIQALVHNLSDFPTPEILLVRDLENIQTSWSNEVTLGLSTMVVGNIWENTFSIFQGV